MSSSERTGLKLKIIIRNAFMGMVLRNHFTLSPEQLYQGHVLLIWL